MRHKYPKRNFLRRVRKGIIANSAKQTIAKIKHHPYQSLGLLTVMSVVTGILLVSRFRK